MVRVYSEPAHVKLVNGPTGEIKEWHQCGTEPKYDINGDAIGRTPWERSPLALALGLVPTLVDAIRDAHQRERHLVVTLAEVDRQ